MMKTRYELRALRQVDLHESIEQAHQKIFAPLAAQTGPWKLKELPPAPKVIGGDISAHRSLRRYLPGTAKGYMNYQFRGDRASGILPADSLELDFTPYIENYGPLLVDTLPLLIRSMRPYVVELGDVRFRDPVISGDVLPPFGAERGCGGNLYPVFFLSDWALVELYDVELEDAIRKLTPIAEQVTRLEDGLYVVGSSKILAFEEAVDLAHRLEASLKPPKAGLFPRLLSMMGLSKRDA
jgi:hypothetical protein